MEPEEPPLLQQGKVFFENSLTLEHAFAGDLTGNLRKMRDVFGDVFTVRDVWIQIADEASSAREFVETLARFRKTCGRRLDQAEFDWILDVWRRSGSVQELRSYFAERIKVGQGRRDVSPRSLHQLEYVRAMRTQDLVFGVGPAGTGKTYLAMAMAVSSLLEQKHSRIVLTRPAVEAGESLGFLPGTLQEKINPYLRPLYDALYEMLDFRAASDLLEKNVIEVAPLAFMRGRTLNDAFVILDEAQNTTSEQMFMFLTRLGHRAKCVVCGDPSQTDLPAGRESGLLRALDRLSDIPEIAICRFTATDVVRHPLVEKIIRAYGVFQS